MASLHDLQFAIPVSAALALPRAQRLRNIAADLPLCHASVRAAFEAGQFELAYQPILRLPDLSLAGCEALLRWNHPVRGAQSPAQFIPIIERSRMVSEIGEWVLTQAAMQVRRWQTAGTRLLRLSVNVAPLQVLSPDFPASVRRSLDGSGLAPENLSLDITQDLMMNPSQPAESALAHLAVMGVSVELDDFGGGPSALSQLRSLAIGGFKLDRRFLNGIASTQPGSRNDVRILVGMARELGLRVIAEGVETEAELRAVSELGIQEAQGYLFCRPLSAAAFENYLCARGD